MKKLACLVAVGVLVLLVVPGEAQMLTEKPEPGGGDPIGIWRAEDVSLQAWADPKLLGIVSSLSFGGTVTGVLTMDGLRAYEADYIVNVEVSFTLLGSTQSISLADTTRDQGDYEIRDTDLIFERGGTPVVRDTLGFTAEPDTLRLVVGVPLGEYRDLVTGLAPDADPPVAVIRLHKVGEPETPSGAITADFNGDDKVDFLDFLKFATHFGTRDGDAEYEAIYDLTGDDKVDFLDFLEFAKQYGRKA
jgi:hypothetical protein